MIDISLTLLWFTKSWSYKFIWSQLVFWPLLLFLASLTKAKIAYLRGNRDLAGRFSAAARHHGQAMAEADASAAALIFRSRNPAYLSGSLEFSGQAFLDLHGLHVKEACSLLCSIIQERQKATTGARTTGRMIVCSGAGKHSERPSASFGGQGRLEAAVERVLRSRGITFRCLQSGLYELTL